MGSPNGGIIGVINPTSFGKCTVTTVTTSSGPLTTQPGTRLVQSTLFSCWWRRWWISPENMVEVEQVVKKYFMNKIISLWKQQHIHLQLVQVEQVYQSKDQCSRSSMEVPSIFGSIFSTNYICNRWWWRWN
jgi:hypothetical protein